MEPTKVMETPKKSVDVSEVEIVSFVAVPEDAGLNIQKMQED